MKKIVIFKLLTLIIPLVAQEIVSFLNHEISNNGTQKKP